MADTDPTEENIPLLERTTTGAPDVDDDGLEETDVDKDPAVNPLNQSIPVIGGGQDRVEVDAEGLNSAMEEAFGEEVRRNDEEYEARLEEFKAKAIQQITGHYLTRTSGPNSSTLFDRLTPEYNKEKALIGARFSEPSRGGKVVHRKLYIFKNRRYVFSEAKASKRAIKEYKVLFEKAKVEWAKTPDSIVQSNVDAQIERDAVEDIIERTSEDGDERLQADVDDLTERLRAGNKEDIARQVATALGPVEVNKDELALEGEERERTIRSKLQGLIGPKISREDSSEKENFLDLAKVEKEKADAISQRLAQGGTAEETAALNDKMNVHLNNEKLFKRAAERCDFKADMIRLKFWLKPETDEVKEMLIENREAEPRTKLARFKRWAKRNLGALSAGAIAVAGIITTVAVSLRGTITKGARATGRFAKGVYNALKKLGPVFEIIGKILFTILSLGAQALLFLTNNLWILAILLAYYLYEKFGPSWWKKRNKK